MVRGVHLPSPAYRVPFRFERRRKASGRLLRNVGEEPVYEVTLLSHGHGLVSLSPPAALLPGEALVVVVRQRTPSPLLVVQWVRGDGVEYVWRVST